MKSGNFGNSIKENVQEYYGKTLGGSKDLKTSACCTVDAMAVLHQQIVKEIHEDIVGKFYGCGSPIPSAIEGATVLDLGCGTGRDVYITSKLVGPNGCAIGVDMTDEQLDVAKRNIAYQQQQFGFDKPNVQFIKGDIEDLESLGIQDNSIDVVISNCVLNLAPQKERVFSEIFRVLKPGGELYFSDVYADRRVPDELRRDPVLVGECLAGALYVEDFRRILEKMGCLDHRVISRSPITLKDPEVKEKLGMIDFYSMTIRSFKLDDLEDRCENYGEEAVYLGTVEGAADRFTLDDHHIFTTNKSMKVCGNTASMLKNTRFSKHFAVTGNRATHYGSFDCTEKGCAEQEAQTSCC